MFLSPSMWRLDSSPGATKLGPVGPDIVVKAEQRFIMDRLRPILSTTASICFGHDSLHSRVTTSRSPQLAQFSHYSLQDLVEV